MKRLFLVASILAISFPVCAQSVSCGWEKAVLPHPEYYVNTNGEWMMDEVISEKAIPQSSNPNDVTSGSNGFNCSCLASMSDEAAMQVAKVDPAMFEAILACKQ